MKPILNRQEYNKARSEFLQWAWNEGLIAGSDEAGYHDDEPTAAEAWKAWFAKAQAAKLMTANVMCTPSGASTELYTKETK